MVGSRYGEGTADGFEGGKKGENKRCSTKREAERNSEGGKGRRMNKKINI